MFPNSSQKTSWEAIPRVVPTTLRVEDLVKVRRASNGMIREDAFSASDFTEAEPRNTDLARASTKGGSNRIVAAARAVSNEGAEKPSVEQKPLPSTSGEGAKIHLSVDQMKTAKATSIEIYTKLSKIYSDSEIAKVAAMLQTLASDTEVKEQKPAMETGVSPKPEDECSSTTSKNKSEFARVGRTDNALVQWKKLNGLYQDSPIQPVDPRNIFNLMKRFESYSGVPTMDYETTVSKYDDWAGKMEQLHPNARDQMTICKTCGKMSNRSHKCAKATGADVFTGQCPTESHLASSYRADCCFTHFLGCAILAQVKAC